MGYQDTNLNGWDYVLAITEEQVNNGLKILFEKDYLPKSFSKEESILGMKVTSKGDFGCPTVHAIRDGLKLCDLVLPLVNASMDTPMGSLPIPAGSALRITTSLASIESEIIKNNQKSYDVYVDFKDKNAAYNVNIDGMPRDQVAILENMLKEELQNYKGHEYKVGSYILASEIDPFIPRLVDFSFILNSEDPNNSAFLLCCAFDDKGPQVENRLVFESKILPNNLPAALWVGKKFVMSQTIQPLVSDSLKEDYPKADMAYDGDKTVKLNSAISIGKPDNKHDADMQEFAITSSGGQLKIHSVVKIYDITMFNIDAVATVDGHIAITTSADQITFTSSSGVDDHRVETEGPSTFLQVVLGILTLGIIPLIIAILEHIIEDKVGSTAGDSLNNKLKTATNVMNNIARKIPALEDLTVNGHLLFDDITLQDSGAVCIGIKDTKSA